MLNLLKQAPREKRTGDRDRSGPSRDLKNLGKSALELEEQWKKEAEQRRNKEDEIKRKQEEEQLREEENQRKEEERKVGYRGTGQSICSGLAEFGMFMMWCLFGQHFGSY